jgi:subtilisin family serine protease
MKVILALLLVGVAAALAFKAPLLNADSTTVVPGEYIVVLKPEVNLQSFLLDVNHQFVSATGRNTLLFPEGFSINGEFQGFSASLSDEMLEKIRHNKDVLFIEANQVVNISQGACAVQTNAIWNLNRVAVHQRVLNGRYEYLNTAGQGVNAYIIDTGIYTQNVEFEGRAQWGWAVDNSFVDGNGHGTHVAGTVGGRLYGVAKKTTLVAVKVLLSNGSGTTAGVIQGVNWVTSNARKPAVANMSLGGGNSAALVNAVEASIRAGIPYAVAAGNSNANACNYSPANAPNALTVGSTTNTDARSSFSNWGTCVDISAPGTSITGPWIGNPNAINTISGTSMASPHVCGGAALVLAVEPNLTPAQVQQRLDASGTRNVITDPRGSPNLLLFAKNCN